MTDSVKSRARVTPWHTLPGVTDKGLQHVGPVQLSTSLAAVCSVQQPDREPS